MRKTVVITGASAGIGRSVARRFAQDGAAIGLIAREPRRLQQTASEVRSLGGTAEYFPLDVADASAVEAAAEQIERRLGTIDIWINGAMATVFAPFHEVEPDEYRRATEVTYLGCVNGTRAALKRMKERNRGTIVQIGSALAYRSIPLQAPYCGAKHAIVGFTDSLRSELLHEASRIKLTVVHLPAVNTPQFDWARNKMPRRPRPLPPIFQPEIAAEAVHYAARHPRREFWITRSTVAAILGQRLCPALLDRLLADQAYAGQQTQEEARPGPDNLFQPVEGIYAAHGRFDAQAKERAPALWAAEQRQALVAGGGLLALGAAAFLLARKGWSR